MELSWHIQANQVNWWFSMQNQDMLETTLVRQQTLNQIALLFIYYIVKFELVFYETHKINIAEI